jgi:hypothetical protein
MWKLLLIFKKQIRLLLIEGWLCLSLYIDSLEFSQIVLSSEISELRIAFGCEEVRLVLLSATETTVNLSL